MSRFAGRTVLVTGAAGDIGQELAVMVAREGAEVAVFDRLPELLDETVARCREVNGGRGVLALGVDQTRREAVDEGVSAVAERFGRIDGLFANAGYGKFAPFLEQPQREWERHVAVNLTGTFNICQAVAQSMVAARAGGAIVVNTSSGARQHTDLLSAYCTTKAGLRMLATGMASELGSHRIRVNCVMPGVIETGMTAPMLQGPDGAAHRGFLLSDTPVGRLGEAGDVAALVAFLLSGDAAFITGASVPVDGGQTILGHPRWFRTDHRDAHGSEWLAGGWR
ncbi:glucose 1-dehydrogenase [Nocardioides humi]|uniref:Glucose 1-dehydrogenase n=1 Tax=Nocardioides humi TaxID=449461 RepID=A0ABN2ABK5_9ACTN